MGATHQELPGATCCTRRGPPVDPTQLVSRREGVDVAEITALAGTRALVCAEQACETRRDGKTADPDRPWSGVPVQGDAWALFRDPGAVQGGSSHGHREDLGTVVAAWGMDDPDRSGITSLDLAREAALSIATAAIGVGDRVAYHALSPGGRSIPAGGGARHLARVRDVVAATGQQEEGSRSRRSPVVPAGSIVFVLSTFVDGVAAQMATSWRAAGHAVVAVDVLPVSDTSRLTREQRIALRTLLAERSDILAELRHAGVEVVTWTDPEIDVAMRLAARRQQRMRAVRR